MPGVHTFADGGHAPHLTGPEDFIPVVGDFASRHGGREVEAAA